MWAALLWKFRAPILCVTAVLALVLGGRIWLSTHDANIKHEVLKGYVHQAELMAANARAAEQKRQADAARAALDEYQRKMAAERADDAAAQRRLEQEISDYEKNIGVDNLCVVSERDRQWLLGNSRP